MAQQVEKGAMDNVVAIAGALVILIVVVFFITSLLNTIKNNSSDLGAEFNGMAFEAANERIAPMGDVHAGEIITGPIIRSGKEIVDAVCASCHSTGVLEAPKIGDAAAWATRFEKGLDGLVGTAISGIGAMPPRGGDATLSDEDIQKAVKYLLDEAGLN